MDGHKSLRFLITGGAGFIGSAVIRHLIANTPHSVFNVDKLTYAGNLDSLADVSRSDRYEFACIDIRDQAAMEKAFESFKPDIVMHLAAESHVDRSITGPSDFIQTNIIGTYTLLEVARTYFTGLSIAEKQRFRFHHVSTDEVYGDLDGTGSMFTEITPYAPSSPYSASKASSDHLVRAWYRTYGLPVLLTNCSNNYGPWQFPEKFIPVAIVNALKGDTIPVYGDGKQIRDWLFVEDHARALVLVAEKSEIGQTYNIGGHNEITNIDVVELICEVLNDMAEKPEGILDFRHQITFVDDRPGHDRRYAIDASKIESDLGWKPLESFESGITKTIDWYRNSD